MRAAAEHVWGSPTLAGRRVGVDGLGKVGGRLVEHLLEDGAEIVAYVGADTVSDLIARHPSVQAVGSPEALAAEPMDIYSPNALGGALDDATVSALHCAIVCGAANNQLVQRQYGRRPGLPRDPLHARLPRQRRRRHPGGRRAARLRRRPRPRSSHAASTRPHARSWHARQVRASCPRRPPTGSPRSGSPRVRGSTGCSLGWALPAPPPIRYAGPSRSAERPSDRS